MSLPTAKILLGFSIHLSSCNRAKGTTVYHCIYFFGHIFASKADRDHHELACPYLYYGPRYVRENTELKIDSNQKTLFSGENEPLPPQADLGLVDKKPAKEEKKAEIIKTFMYITMHFDDNDIQNSIQNNPTQEIFELNSKAFQLKTVLMVILCCKLGTNLKPERLEIESVVPVTEIDKQLRERKYEFKAKIACFTELDISDNANHAARLRKHLTTNVGIIKRPQENEVGIIMSSDSELVSDFVNHQLPFKKANVFYLCVVPYAQYADVAILRSEPSYFFEERDLAELTKKMKMINLNSGDRQQNAGSYSSDKLQKEIREIQEKMRKEEREIKERANPLG